MIMFLTFTYGRNVEYFAIIQKAKHLHFFSTLVNSFVEDYLTKSFAMFFKEMCFYKSTTPTPQSLYSNQNIIADKIYSTLVFS